MLKMKKLLPLLPMLLLAGCYNAPTTTIVEKPRPVGRAQGVDLATDAGQVAHPAAGAVAAHQVAGGHPPSSGL